MQKEVSDENSPFNSWRDNLYLFNYRSVHTEPVEYFHYHEGLEILYIHEGAGRYIVDNQTYSLKPGTLVLIKPFQIHHIKVIVPPNYIRDLLKIKASVIERFLTALPRLTTAVSQLLDHPWSNQVFHLSSKDSIYLENQFLQLHEMLASVPPKAQKEVVALFLFHFFTYFNSHIYPPDRSGVSSILLPLDRACRRHGKVDRQALSSILHD